MEGSFPTLSESARRWVRLLAVLAVAALLGWVAYVTRSVFATPAALALAIAYILNPLVTWCERRWRLPRLATVSVVFLLLLALVISGGVDIGTRIVGQIEGFSAKAGDYAEQLDQVIRAHTAPPADTQTTQGAFNWREVAVALVREHGAAVAERVSTYVSSTVSNVIDIGSLLVLVPLLTFFALWRFNDLVRTVRDHLPAASRATIVHVVSTIDHAVAGFFRGRLIICLIIGLLSALGWSIARVPYGLLLGLLCGVLSLVPFLPLLILPPVLLLAYAGVAPGGDWKWPVIFAMGVYVAVQTLDSFVLSPYFLGRTAGLHPVTTLVVLLVGGQLAGLLGMLLAVPVAGTLKTLAIEFVLPEVRRMAGHAGTDTTASAGRPQAGRTTSGADHPHAT